MGTFILILIVGAAIYGVVFAIKQNAQYQAENNTFAGEHRGWDVFISPHDRGVLALNHNEKQIVVGKVANHNQLPWSDISAVEIDKNGQSITQTNRGSQVMGAAAGAVLLGPVGLLLGGLSGSKRNKERVNELSLKILVDDPRAPVHRIVFFRMTGNGADAKSAALKEPAQKLEHYHALISNAIRSDQRQFSQGAVSRAAVGTLEDQVTGLWNLRQAGALTDAEFTAGKAAILSGSKALGPPDGHR